MPRIRKDGTPVVINRRKREELTEQERLEADRMARLRRYRQILDELPAIQTKLTAVSDDPFNKSNGNKRLFARVNGRTFAVVNIEALAATLGAHYGFGKLPREAEAITETGAQ